MSKYVFCIIAIVLATLRITSAEVIDIEEVIPKISSQDSILKSYSLKLDQAYYSSICNSNYLAMTTAIPDTHYVKGRPRRTMNPSEVLLFDYKNHITSTKNKTFISFIPDTNAYHVYSLLEERGYKNEVFSFSGELLGSIVGGRLRASPDLKYFYTMVTIMDWIPLVIYDLEGNQIYKFPITKTYIVNALSGGKFVIAEENRVSLWDINTKSYIWSVECPGRSYYPDEAYNIHFSPSRRTIMVRDMNIVHFIDMGGKIIGSIHDITSGYSIGISADDKFISFAAGGYSHLVFQLYNITGEKLSESDSYIGPELVRVSTWDKTVYVDEGFRVARFTARNINSSEKLYITGICTKINGEYKVFAVDGLWYYLEKDDNEGTLVGFRNDQSEIVGYSVILK